MNDKRDIVERLRARTTVEYEGRDGKTIPDPLCQEAADEIERLRAQTHTSAQDRR